MHKAMTNEPTVNDLIDRARAAMLEVAGAPQERIDEIVTAIAWSLYQPKNARSLAEMEVEDTGLGNVNDKVIKNQRKTFGALRDLMRVNTVGIIESDTARGLVKYGKPVGVVAALAPSTNLVATAVNKSMMAIKGGNAIVIAPSPSGWRSANEVVELMRSALLRISAPPNLVQILSQPITRDGTKQLMQGADLVVVTGSQNNVKAATLSGTPNIGVGAGNVPVIIDSSAALDDAAKKICASKTFDNATSCSSENSLIILDDIYDDAIHALKLVGGHLLSDTDTNKIKQQLWIDGKLNRDLIARDADVFAKQTGINESAQNARFFMAEESVFDPASPFANEKLSLVLSVYRAKDFNHAIQLVINILNVSGKGHSCGIHTQDLSHPKQLAEQVDVVRVLVNQSHTFGNGGNFNNALNFTLSMGCGTWGGNIISENLSYKNFINITHLVTTVEEDKPTEEKLFGAHFAKYGRE